MYPPRAWHECSPCRLADNWKCWPMMVSYGPFLPLLAPFGHFWPLLAPFGPFTLLVPFDPFLLLLKPYGPFWPLLASFGRHFCPLRTPFGPFWAMSCPILSILTQFGPFMPYENNMPQLKILSYAQMLCLLINILNLIFWNLNFLAPPNGLFIKCQCPELNWVD
jgi:hypothetical protein